MPPRYYPKLPLEASEQKHRVRTGYLTLEQVKAVINKTPALEQRTTFKVTYFCGLRASEVGLQPERHFDSKRGTLDIVRLKGSLGRTYQLLPWVLEDLEAWMDERPKSPFIFAHPNEAKAPLDRFNMFRWWRAAVQREGLDVRRFGHPHVLKHSIATHLFEKGNGIEFVRDWLGHKRMESTQVYAEIVGKRLEEGNRVMQGIAEELSS